MGDRNRDPHPDSLPDRAATRPDDGGHLTDAAEIIPDDDAGAPSREDANANRAGGVTPPPPD